MARVDYDRQSAVYDRGRRMTPEAIAAWMVAAARHVRDEPRRLLDLGAGTGRFSAPLAESFGSQVIAVEPSSGMRGHAAARPHPRVHLVGGAAEHIPLAEDSCDLAWLSNVIHHLDEPTAAAAELRRVVVEGGNVLLRGAFGGRSYDLSLYRFFPEAAGAIADFPTLDDILALFQEAGFTSFYVEQVRQLTAPNLTELLDAARHRADTALEAISDEAFERGLERLEDAARVEHGPVLDSLDLVIVR